MLASTTAIHRRFTRSLLFGLSLALVVAARSAGAAPATPQDCDEVPVIDMSSPKKASAVKQEIDNHGVFVPVFVTEVPFLAAKNKTVIKIEPQETSAGGSTFLTAGQLMHVYVAGSGTTDPTDPDEPVDPVDPGPLDGRPMVQWGTILASIAFVICIGIRIFKKS